ncbi:MAG: ABC transporter ATP-binding protein [Streptosporangiales bacterium]
MSETVLDVQNVGRRFGNLVALEDIDLHVAQGSVHAVIGPNGAGKTTLFNILSGELTPTSGRVVFEGRRIDQLRPDVRAHRGIGRSFQVTSIFQTLTVFENVRIAAQASRRRSAFNFLAPVRTSSAASERAWEVLDRVGLRVDEAGIPAGELSHGRQRLLGVALALAGQPRLLLLDEPCAGMGSEDVVLMQDLLEDLAKDHTIVLIEHHVELVMAVSDVVTVLDHGALLVEGDPRTVGSHPRVREAYLGVGL